MTILDLALMLNASAQLVSAVAALISTIRRRQ
jgi:hypothetical protein